MKHREIDRKIAELMGYSVRVQVIMGIPHFSLVGGNGNELSVHGLEIRAWEAIPRFTSDWNAMRLLVEWLQGEGWKVDFEIYPADKEFSVFCYLQEWAGVEEGWEELSHSHASAPPLALCKAVLALPTELLRPKGNESTAPAQAEGGNHGET